MSEPKKTENSEEEKNQTKFQFGLELGCFKDVRRNLDAASNNSCHFICGNPRNSSLGFQLFTGKDQVFTWNCLDVESTEREDSVVGVLSDYRKEVKNGILSSLGVKFLTEEELQFFQYFGVCVIVVDIHEEALVQIANLVISMLLGDDRNLKPNIWVRCKLGFNLRANSTKDNPLTGPEIGYFKLWKDFMTFCDHHWKIYPVLELTRHKPTEVELNLWIKEEIKAIFIPAELFNLAPKNPQNHPMLLDEHKDLLHKFLAGKTAQFVIKISNTKQGSHCREFRRFVECTCRLWDEEEREREKGKEVVIAKTEADSVPTAGSSNTYTPVVTPGSLSFTFGQLKVQGDDNFQEKRDEKGAAIKIKEQQEQEDGKSWNGIVNGEVVDESRFWNDD